MVYFFQAGVPFSSKNAKGTAFSKAFSDNINTNPHISLLKIQDTPSQVPNAPSQVTNTPPKCKRHQVRQPKTASTPTKTASTVNIDLRCFVAMQFLSQIYALFWRTIYRPKNVVAYKKWQIWGMLRSTCTLSESTLRQGRWGAPPLLCDFRLVHWRTFWILFWMIRYPDVVTFSMCHVVNFPWI